METAIDRAFALANRFEAGLWLLIASALLCAIRGRMRVVQLRLALAAALFAAFGGSDVVEASTGAWWRPWWLLTWKTACVAGLLGIWLDARRRK